MDREYQSITGALDSHIQHPSKASYTREQLKPTKNKSKAGVQRHTRTSYPTNRTTASIVTNKSGRLTEHKPGKKAHSRRSSRHRSTISHRHSTPQTRPPKNNRQDSKSYTTKYSSPPHLQGLPHGATKPTHTKHKPEITASGGTDLTTKGHPQIRHSGIRKSP